MMSERRCPQCDSLVRESSEACDCGKVLAAPRRFRLKTFLAICLLALLVGLGVADILAIRKSPALTFLGWMFVFTMARIAWYLLRWAWECIAVSPVNYVANLEGWKPQGSG